MENTLQKTFNLNQSSYIMRTQPIVQRHKTENIQKVNPQNGDTDHNNTIMRVLGGLAILGAAGLLIRTNLIAAKNQQFKEGYDVIEVIKLREYIKNEYKAKRKVFNEKLNDYAKSENLPLFTSRKDLEANIRRLEHTKAAWINEFAELKVRNNNKIKEKLRMLAQNAEWKELRTIRKNLLETLERSSKVPSDEHKIAKNKIMLINDLIINAVYPEEKTAFVKYYNMDEKSVLDIVKGNYENVDEYYKTFAEKQINNDELDYYPLRERNFSHALPLQLIDIFPNEIASNMACDAAFLQLKSDIMAHKQFFEKYLELQKEFITEFRNSENVRKLHAELSKKE